VLPPEWDAHHRIPHANGGGTEITNGMALCRECHVRLHRSKTMIKPRKWQAEFLQKYRYHDQFCFLLEATPGSGKTIASALAFASDLENDVADFAIIVTPGTVIKGDSQSGFLGDWNKVGIQITTVLKDGQGCPTEFKGAVITYAQLPNIVPTLEIWARNGVRITTIGDEAHHGSLANKWGHAFQRLAQASIKVLLISGTPFRSDGEKIPFVDYDEKGHATAHHSYTYREAVRDNVCREIEFFTDDGLAEFVWRDEEATRIKLSDAKQDKDIAGASATIFRRHSDWLAKAIEKVSAAIDEDRTFDMDAAALVICKPGEENGGDEAGYSLRYLHQVEDLIRRLTGDEPVVVSYDDADANAKIEKFRKSTDRFMCAVRKVSEGVDIKRLRVGLLATAPGTELLFRQLVGRLVRVDDEKNPGTARMFMPKFAYLEEWAKRISDEAKAGIRDREKIPGEGGGRDREQSAFRAIHDEHIDGGGISDWGESFTASEINYAESVKADDTTLVSTPVTTIAHILRKINVEPDESAAPQEPLVIRKKKLRRKVVNAAQQLAYRRDPDNPDFSSVWVGIHNKFRVKNIDDLTDNHSIEVMEQVLAYVMQQLGVSRAA
jgi:superfamily II DNA or RNA helicase